MINQKYSNRDFAHKTFLNTDPSEWNDTEVVNSCFYNETPNTKVFPDGIKGVRFIRCNLDNVVVPPECVIEGGCHRLIQVQNDLEDWFLDEDLKPIEPMRKAKYVKLGLSILPKDIPEQKASMNIIEAKLKELEDNLRLQIETLEATAIWRKG